MELVKIIESFITSASEGPNWDFKQVWYHNNADMLKDILCMANNATQDMRDGYIIIGVEDKTYNIIGVAEDKQRKNKENIIGFLSEQSWSAEEIPMIDVQTVTIRNKEIDVIIIFNSDKTPFYLLKDYEKNDYSGKNKVVVRAGVVYSRVGDRNTSSAACATKDSVEFLWKKRFGLAGTDEFKVIKRLQDAENWYTVDEGETFYNRQYSDIQIRQDKHWEITAKINAKQGDTATWLMDFPYLFASLENWNLGLQETGWRRRWYIFLEGRKLDIVLYGVQSSRQTYYHIEPEKFRIDDLGLYMKDSVSVPYYAYFENSIELLAYQLFAEEGRMSGKQSWMRIIPVFKDHQEHAKFLEYIASNKGKFVSDVESMNVDDIFPSYARDADTVIVYKLCKTMTAWLGYWRIKCRNSL